MGEYIGGVHSPHQTAAAADTVLRLGAQAADLARRRLPPRWQQRVAPAYRRARREWQWQQHRSELDVQQRGPEGFDHVVVEHRTLMLRRLAGVDMQLQHNKVTNLRLAVATLDGVVLEPGQRLSFWRQVGRPTAERGFLDGLILSEGRSTAGVGGGLCQLTNLLHWMTIHTDLTVAERWRHSYDVFPDSNRTLPFASGATCAWPSLDLQIRNDTSSRWRLGLTVGERDLEGEWRCSSEPLRRYAVYEAAHVVTNDAPGVYMRRNILRRKAFDTQGKFVDDEMVCPNHARMTYNPMLGAGPVKLAVEQGRRDISGTSG